MLWRTQHYPGLRPRCASPPPLQVRVAFWQLDPKKEVILLCDTSDANVNPDPRFAQSLYRESADPCWLRVVQNACALAPSSGLLGPYKVL